MLSDESICILGNNPVHFAVKVFFRMFCGAGSYVEKSEGSQLSGRDIFGWFGCLGGHASSGWLLSKPRAVGC